LELKEFISDSPADIYMLFTGCEVRMTKTVPEVLKTARARRARDVFKTEISVVVYFESEADKN
jgi:hypothetical protein